MLSDAVAYRDRRTDGIAPEVEKLISSEELYQRTGIQKINFNTIYQLAALKKEHPEVLEEAQSMLKTGPWYALSTGLTIVLLVFGVGLIGEGLQAQDREVA